MYSKENLAKLKKMDSLAPQVMKAFWATLSVLFAYASASALEPQILASLTLPKDRKSVV